MKLRFFLAVGLLAPAQAQLPAAVEAAPPGQWLYDEEADPITDLRGAIAMIKSTDGQSLLAIACDHQQRSRPMYFQLRTRKLNFFSSSPRVSIRVNDEKPFSESWSVIASALIAYDPAVVRGTARALISADRVYVRALDSNYQAVDAEFHMKRPGEVMTRVATACGHPRFPEKDR